MKRITAIAIMLALMFTLVGCGDETNRTIWNTNPSVVIGGTPLTTAAPEHISTYDGPPGTWAVYWYLCGSDLESGSKSDRPEAGGAATSDLSEMLKVALPDNVTVIIETGGAKEWKNDFIKPDVIGRYLYSGNVLTELESQPSANMGDPQTLADFLRFCNENYPAEHQAVIFWDHGGGSLLGVAMDELYDGNLLSLPEMRQAFQDVPAVSGMYEMVGFDACLMATVEVAEMLSDSTRYLVASEESEPGFGWDYTGLFTALGADTTMDGAELGKAICDSYYATCEQYNFTENITLSVTDLSRFAPLLAAYRAVGDEALLKAYEQKLTFYSAFEGAAYAAESYGVGRNGVSDYDMVDLGHLMRNTASLLDGEEAVLSALADCVVYNVKGSLRGEASGLACYFIYSGDVKALDIFSELGVSEGFRYLYEYPLKGELSQQGADYINALSVEPVPLEAFPNSGLEQLNGYPVRGEKGAMGFLMTLDAELQNNIANITSERYYVLAENTEGLSYDNAKGAVSLGYEFHFAQEVDAQGNMTLRDGFKGYWYSLGGALISVYSDETPQLNEDKVTRTLRVPVLLNGEPFTLLVENTILLENADSEGLVTNPEDITFNIYGARKDSDATTGLPSKELRQLEEGDVIEPLFEVFYSDGNVDFADVADLKFGAEQTRSFQSIVWSEDIKIEHKYLGDGLYFSKYRMTDLAGQPHYSQSGWYVVQDGEVYSYGPINK
ncbi:MAG: hypothetical protein LBN43_03770 [Oscillospiraceae bacterium]|jgi:hypothetical protein|nr:hypothetical protein [Oscillospiraceae bacterium]